MEKMEKMKVKAYEKDPRLLLPLSLLHKACNMAPCYTSDDCEVFKGVECKDCPIMAAIKFISKEIEE